MISSKQRSYLKSLANTLQVKVIIGKYGLTDSVMNQIRESLDASELVKIKILNNNMDDHDQMVQEVLKELGAEFVSHLGSKFVIYKQSKDKIINLP